VRQSMNGLRWSSRVVAASIGTVVSTTPVLLRSTYLFDGICSRDVGIAPTSRVNGLVGNCVKDSAQ
jgi:hypothetical protein